jgi:hypothetical protein
VGSATQSIAGIADEIAGQGKAIAKQGQPGREFFVIVEVRPTSRSTEEGRRPRSGDFGEMALTDKPRIATARREPDASARDRRSCVQAPVGTTGDPGEDPVDRRRAAATRRSWVATDSCGWADTASSLAFAEQLTPPVEASTGDK